MVLLALKHLAEKVTELCGNNSRENKGKGEVQ